MEILSNVVGDSDDDEDTFSHKLLLINTQVPKFGKVFANNSSANIKLSKIQLNKIAQDFFGRIIRIIIKLWIAFNRKCTSAIN